MKKLFLILIMFFVMLQLSIAATPTDGVTYYNFSGLNDLWGVNDATNQGADSFSSYPSFHISGNSAPNSFDFEAASSEYVEMPDFGVFGSDYGVSFWFNADVVEQTTAIDELVMFRGEANLEFRFRSGKFQFKVYDGGAERVLDFTPSTGQWYHIVGTQSSSNGMTLYVNGVDTGDGSSYTSFPASSSTANLVGAMTSSLYFYDGLIDEIKIFEKELNSTDVANIYNYGYITGAPPLSNFTIKAEDYLGNSLNSFTANVSGTMYNTTVGLLTTSLLNNDTSLHTIVVDSENYSSVTYNNYNLTLNLQVVLYPENTVNITFLYEENNTLADNINITIEFISDSFSVETNTSNGTIEYKLGYPDDYIIRFSTFNNITNINLSRIYTFRLDDDTYDDLTLYIPRTSSDLVEINVFDSFQYPLVGGGAVGVVVKVLKYFVESNSYIQISSQETNFEGQITEYLDLGTSFYKFIVEYDDKVVLTTGSTYIYESPVNLYATTLESGFNTLFAITGFYGVIDHNTSSNVLTYTWDDNDNLATRGCLYVYRTNTLNTVLVNNSCVSGAAGSLNIVVASINGSYEAKGYITKAGQEYYITQKYFNIGGTETFNDNNSLLLVAFFVITMFFIGYFALELAMVLSGVAVLFTSITGLFSIGLGVAIPVFVLSLVLAFIISRYRRGGFL